MERFKMIFNDKSIKYTTFIILAILLTFIILGQFIVMGMADNYKKDMIEHDYAIAGHLSQSGIDNSRVAEAFLSDKTAADTRVGSALLSFSGYKGNIQSRLLPEVDGFHQNFSRIVFAFSALFSLFLLVVLYCSLRCRDKRLEVAESQLRRFMDGDISIRLSDGGEGRIFRFFAAINAMATSLTAHVEKEKQSRQFLKNTISDITHQLKTPLAALQMYNEIILDEKTGNEVVESFASKSRRELNRMESLIQSLLKLAKLDAGTIELNKGNHNLINFIKNVVNVFLTRAELEGKKINIQCDNSAILCFDEIWLGEAVGNIVKNALDHTSAGNLIEITCDNTVVATEIIVRDNGTGIHPEDIHYIFRRFYRSRFSKDREGVGIGLALSKAIVEKHGGTITVQSELGKGAAFHLIFPKLSEL